MNNIVEIQKIAEEIHVVSSKIAQEAFLERRNLILEEITKLTGQDYTHVIPAVRKGRPSKVKAPSD
jgi:hypothetical protein